MTRFYLPVGPSLNGMFKNARKGRMRTDQYKKWATTAGHTLNLSRARPVASPVAITMSFGRLNIQSDISNRCKALEDLLVTHGIIEDDSVKHVRRIVLEYTPETVSAGYVEILIATMPTE